MGRGGKEEKDGRPVVVSVSCASDCADSGAKRVVHGKDRFGRAN